jgi:hypothetical protein
MATNEWLRELFGQLAFVSSVLGGFAVAFLGTLLTIEAERRITRWTMGAAAVSAAAFVAAAVIAALNVADTVRTQARDLTGLGSGGTTSTALAMASFALGFLGLMISLALSGWIKSRSLGLVTTLGATACLLAVVLSLATG